MTDEPKPLTEEELAAIEEAARSARLHPPDPGGEVDFAMVVGEEDKPESVWVSLTPDMAERLIADIRRMRAGDATSDQGLTSETSRLVPELHRLRALIRRAVREFDGGEGPEDYEQGLCFWCGEATSPGQGKPHALTCPWPELVAEAERG